MEANLPENRGLDDELFIRILAISGNAVIFKNTNITIRYLGEGIACLEMLVIKKFANPNGLLHGGIIAMLADTALGYSMSTLNINGVTLELNVNYIAPVQIGAVIIAEANVLHRGKNTVVAETSIFDKDRGLIARSRGTFFIVDRSQNG